MGPRAVGAVLGPAAVTPAPWWLVAGCLVAGLGVGELLRRHLRTLGYRIDDEVGQGPPPRWDLLLTVGVGAAWALLAWRLGGEHGAVLLPAHLLLGAVGGALFRIDLDVHRLPEGLTLPALAAGGVLLLPAAVVSGWQVLAAAAGSAVAVYVVMFLLALLSRGAVGLGDATLAGLLALVVGSRGPLLAGALLLYAFLLGGVGALGALVTRRATLKSSIAFGPYLLLGALVAVLLG